MEIVLYNNNSEKNKLDKSLGKIIEFNDAHLKENTTIRNPIFVIQKGDFVVRNNVNYLWCSTFQRYYFVDEITFGVGGVLLLHCSCDVLMTFKDKIKELSCVFARQENLFNTYLNDSEFMCYNTPLIIQKKFPNGFADGFSGVLTVVGGGD